jgi:hypothetical protein
VACKAATRDDDERRDELSDQSIEALRDLVAATPTTIVGCAAVLRAVQANADEYDQGWLFQDCGIAEEPARDLLSRIAAVLEKAVQS